MIVKAPLALQILILGTFLGGCSGFSQRFSQIQRDCGVPPQADRHYIQILSSEGRLLSQSDLAAFAPHGRENSAIVTAKGCVAVPKNGENASLLIRNRNKAEGIVLHQADFQEAGRLSEKRLRPLTYAPPQQNCQGSLVSKENEIVLYRAEVGQSADIYDLKFSITGAPHLAAEDITARLTTKGSAATFNISGLADGQYTLQGKILEVFSPEQRSYSMECVLTVDRIAPIVQFQPRLFQVPEIVTGPGEALEFLVSEPESTVAVCLQAEADFTGSPCLFQDLTTGRFTAPARGIYRVQVRATDKAGNVGPVSTSQLRIFDTSRIQALQGDMEEIGHLIDDQKGGDVRKRIPQLLQSYAKLGTEAEKNVVRRTLEETLYAAIISPTEIRFPASDGTYINWVSQQKKNLLVFYVASPEPTIIFRDEAGRVVREDKRPAALDSNPEICSEGTDRILFANAGPHVYRLDTEGLRLVRENTSIAQVQYAGACRYRKIPNGPGSWTVLDTVSGKSRVVSALDLWVMTASAESTATLLIKTSRAPTTYATQTWDASGVKAQPSLNGLDIHKIPGPSRLIAGQSQNEARDFFVFHYDAANDEVTLDSTLNAIQGLSTVGLVNNKGGDKTFFRLTDSSGSPWVIHNSNFLSDRFIQSYNLSAGIAPEGLKLGSDILAANFDNVPGKQSLVLYDPMGNILSAFSFDKATDNLVYSTLIGNQVQLADKEGFTLVNPFPHFTLSQARSASPTGGQWGPFWTADNKAFLYQTSNLMIINEGGLHLDQWTADGKVEVTSTDDFPDSNIVLRSVEKPFEVWSFESRRGTAYIRNRKSLVVQSPEQVRLEWTLPAAENLIRVDAAADGKDLLLLDTAGRLFKKSWQNPDREAILMAENIRPGCGAQDIMTALDYNTATSSYFGIACQQLFTVDRSGGTQILVLESKLDGSPLAVQSSVDGQTLAVLTQRGPYILSRKGDSWTPAPAFAPQDYPAGVTFGRWSKDLSRVLLLTKENRVFLGLQNPAKIRELRRASSRPLTIDDLRFNEDSSRIYIAALEGILEVPASLKDVVDELCQGKELSCPAFLNF